MARKLKIPAEGGGRGGRRGEEPCSYLAGPVGDILGAGDVLYKVYVVCVVVVLVHAFAGGPLPLELPPLWGTWGNNCVI